MVISPHVRVNYNKPRLLTPLVIINNALIIILVLSNKNFTDKVLHLFFKFIKAGFVYHIDHSPNFLKLKLFQAVTILIKFKNYFLTTK